MVTSALPEFRSFCAIAFATDNHEKAEAIRALGIVSAPFDKTKAFLDEARAIRKAYEARLIVGCVVSDDQIHGYELTFLACQIVS